VRAERIREEETPEKSRLLSFYASMIDMTSDSSSLGEGAHAVSSLSVSRFVFS
jgi:hypothetical protein